MAKAVTGREKVRQWREVNAVSLAELAERMGYADHSRLSRWERNKGGLEIAALCMLEEITGIPAETLAGEQQAEQIRLIRGR